MGSIKFSSFNDKITKEKKLRRQQKVGKERSWMEN